MIEPPKIHVHGVRHGELLQYYCGIQAFFYASNALAYWYALDRLSNSPAFRIVDSIIGLGWWAAIMGVMGFLFVGAVIRPHLVGVRVLLTVSVGIKVMFGISLIASNYSPGGFSYLALAATDLLVASAPIAAAGKYPAKAK